MSMTDEQKIDAINDAITEAKRFIEKANHSLIRFKSLGETFYNSPSFAAAKRSSMDLTRALAAMRK